MNTRLKQFIAAENLSQSQFADNINVVRASVSHVLSGRNNPGYDFIKAIMLAYPNLNIEWLMLGKGKMYKSMPQETSLFFEEDLNIFKPDDEIMPPTVEDFPTDPQPEVKNSISEPTFTPTEVSQSPKAQRKATKVVIFFDDGTYQEM